MTFTIHNSQFTQFTIEVEEIACIETYKVFNPNLDFIKEKEVEVVVDRCRLIKSQIPQK